MTEQAIISELNLLEAHGNEFLKIAARLRKKLQPVSTGRSKKKKGLAPDTQAQIIGRKRLNQIKKATAVTVAQ